MKFFPILLLFSVFFTHTVTAQINPVKWTYASKKINADEYEVTFAATIDQGWNIYSQHTDPSGPVPTSINFENNTEVTFIGETTETGKKKEAFDELFGVNVIKFADKVVFTQKVKTAKTNSKVVGYLEYMCCDDEKCLPPMEVEFSIPLK
ncbi:MAG: protein-disulfide reductase DsbD domain-containing protein [Bacteroidota bacterium]